MSSASDRKKTLLRVRVRATRGIARRSYAKEESAAGSGIAPRDKEPLS